MADFQFQKLVASALAVSYPPRPRTELTADGVAAELYRWADLGGFPIETLGQSSRGVDVRSVTIGAGATNVMAWTQMHGDEPTHTEVVLDLIHLLATQPGHEAVQCLMQNITLILIPMLNPDGAAVNTRRNAQGIDINRDARVVQSPEGQILRDAVLKLAPQFAFNLHNHNPRRTVRGSNRLAAVALLTPPPDASDSEPAHLVRAKQIGSCFCVTVAEECDGMLSRYGADYMPRAFGEWVQSQGASTLLVEAGGWPGGEQARLVDVHFRGLLGSLLAIATDEYASVGVEAYEQLARGEGHERIDCIVRDVEMEQPDGAQYKTDLGINFSKELHARMGRISDVGDLSVHDADLVVDGKGMRCSLGRVAICQDVGPAMEVDSFAAKLLSQGITTVVGVVDMKDATSVSSWQALNADSKSVLNVAFAVAAKEDTTFKELASAVAWGAVAIVMQASSVGARNAAAEECAQLFGLPLVSLVGDDGKDGVIEWGNATGESFFASREVAEIGAPADLVVMDGNGQAEIVLVNGGLAFSNGRCVAGMFGRLIRVGWCGAARRP